jgi:hypothetical protein
MRMKNLKSVLFAAPLLLAAAAFAQETTPGQKPPETAPLPETPTPKAGEPAPKFSEPLPLIPETPPMVEKPEAVERPEAVEKPGAAAGRGQRGKRRAPQLTSVRLDERIRIREVKTLALKDQGIVQEKLRADAAKTDAGKREGLKKYYERLYARMGAIEPKFKAKFDQFSTRMTKRLDQHRIEPSELIEEEFENQQRMLEEETVGVKY